MVGYARGVSRRSPLALCLVALAACSSRSEAPPLELVSADVPDVELAALDPALHLSFARGDARFDAPFLESEGLGPHYVHRACVACHEDDARGPGVVRRLRSNGTPLPFGDVVRPRVTDGATPVLARDGDIESVRLPLAVFGRGLLEAIDDDTILAWESAQRSGTDGIHGRAARLPTAEPMASSLGASAPALGRFGHKARSATLEAFVADALHSDMGLTSAARPNEVIDADEGLDARPGIDVPDDVVRDLVAYVRLLSLPARAEASDHEVGAARFAEVGCATCHVPEARTRADHPIAALRDRAVSLYTDLLLHDLGEGLDDGIREGAASGREWRTAPLIGLRFLRGLLHDGRAADVVQAIEAHASPGSEANAVVARYHDLDEADRTRLVRFVEAL